MKNPEPKTDLDDRGTGGTWSLAAATFAVLCLMATVGFVLTQPRLHGVEARSSATIADIRNISTALDAFGVDCGRYPTTAEGLGPLVKRPAGANDWHGPYLDHIPSDPWGHPYIYVCPGVHNPNSFDLYSCGPDGISRTGGDDKDDIGNWVGALRFRWRWDAEATGWQGILGAGAVCFLLFLWEAGRNWRVGRAAGYEFGLLALLWLAATVPTLVVLVPAAEDAAAEFVGAFALFGWWPPALILSHFGLRRGSSFDRMCAWVALLLVLLFIIVAVMMPKFEG